MYPHTIRLRGPWGVKAAAPAPAEIAMPALLGQAGVQDYWEPVEFTRDFQWVAKLESDERVFLNVDGAVGEATISLNDSVLGRSKGVWGTSRFDITALLKSRNRLRISIHTPRPENLGGDPYGSLGFSAAADASRGAVAGIAGDVALTIELAGVCVASPFVSAVMQPQGGELNLRAAATLEGAFFDRRRPIASLTLDDQPLCESETAVDNGVADLQLAASALKVDPWMPRGSGAARLYDLAFELRAGGVTLHRRQWRIGFPRREGTGISDDETVEELWPARTLAENAGEPLHAPFDRWHIARRTRWRLHNHLAPERFYSLCDRAGIELLQDVPLTGAAHGWDSKMQLLQRLRQIACHPCVVGFRLPCGESFPNSFMDDAWRSMLLRT